MARAYSAGGSRQSAVLVTVVGLHVGLFAVIASGLIPKVREAVWEDGPIHVLPPVPVPETRHAPGNPEIGEVHFPPVPQPDIPIPDFEPADAAPTGTTTTGEAAGGSGVAIPAGGEFVGATLRTRREWVGALIESCYPTGARRDREEGKAIAAVVIGPQGSVLSWSVAESSGFPRLDGAMDCVIGRLVFAPARRDGSAVTAEVRLPIVFRLD
jgi:protein TonB